MLSDPELDNERVEIYADNISEELWEMCFDADLESTVDSVLKRALEKHIEAVEEMLEPAKQLYKFLQQTKN
ncbi:MAG: hypothetical protein ACO3YZ_04485 [Candidatus Nanopelagicaceae bacterium]